MKLYAELKEKNLYFIIDHDELAGYYVYVYEDKKDIPENLHIRDYLQDTLEVAKGFALRKLGVPLDAWVQVE